MSDLVSIISFGEGGGALKGRSETFSETSYSRTFYGSTEDDKKEAKQ